MLRVTFIQPDGTECSVLTAPGTSLMQAAISNGVPGIVGECGGSCMCATCHVMVDPEWLGRLSAPTENEGEMLDFAATERTAESRLGCQIALAPALDGMVVRVPASQV